MFVVYIFFFFQAEDGIRDLVRSRGLGDVYKRQEYLRSLDGVEYVLVFENRGPEVGATIAHPHGQIYAFDHVPARPARRFAAGWRPDPSPGDRLVFERRGWQVVAQHASVFPLSLSISPTERIPDLPAADDGWRDGLADVLVDVIGRLDRLYAVSYTHLRAHETVLDLVCRLLLEKKKKHMMQSVCC